ncbi:hypothetical protein LR948_10530 [Roseivivax sp. GX 12232]|uniref:hypothetical protein n=1 Tax=Roseivivax sp. GX 12232 TaxID=2900547 RepID=UPI001E3E9AB5|nr:hypothetical protein [Roseivivax sp. GX 12232]MCE0505793.1 hypothetical protein [Roseivivax sp. GX 12232]
MRHLLIPAAALLAGPAFAHEGAHLHPHDGAGWLAVTAALAVLALAGVLARGELRLPRRDARRYRGRP